jgi:DNA repair photolyase
MPIKEIHVRTLLKMITKKDTLFHGKYTVDPYQNCSFGCIYCDSISDDTIFVKLNASTVLNKEIQTNTPGRIIIGSVHDPYQLAEEKYHITCDILSVLKDTDFSVHILTKSTAILNDISLIKKLNNPIVTFTILGLDEKIWKTFEPNTPSPHKRLETMQILAEHNIKTGIALIPTFPHLTNQYLTDLIHNAKQHHADYLIHKPLFLQGDQKHLFLTKLKKIYPSLYQTYLNMYHESPTPPKDLTLELSHTIQQLCEHVKLPTSIL